MTLSNIAHADIWGLPIPVNGSNVSIRFEIDSTWVDVKAATGYPKGTIEQVSVDDPLSIRADVELTVALFATADGLGTEELREAMAAEAYPTVKFVSRQLSESCHPDVVNSTGSCTGTLFGQLTIRDVTRSVALPVTITKANGFYSLKGSDRLEWAKYNIDDPSNFINRFDSWATVHYECLIPIRH